MIDRRKLLILTLAPICVIISFCHLDSARGPYYHAHNSDPEYAYLFNSLNLAELKSPSHIDHPGTPLQFLGAFYIGLANIADTSEATQQDVIDNSEHYISVLNIAVVALVAAATLLVGVAACQLSGKLYVGLILQLSVFSSPFIYHELVRLRPENLLIAITYLFLIPIVATLKFPIEEHTRRYLITFALVTGLGVATKIVFAPLAIIPLILFPRWKNKLLFVLFAAIAFLFFTIPIWPRFAGFFSWCYRLLVHSGRYGGGNAEVIDTSTFFDNLLAVLTGNPVFSLVLLASILLVAHRFTSIPQAGPVEARLQFKVLIGLVLAQLCQVLMVSKHYSPHYLLPALMLTGITLVFLILNASHCFDFKPGERRMRALGAIAGIGFCVLTVLGLGNLGADFARRKAGANAVIDAVQRYPEHDKVYYYRSSSRMYALYFGNSFAGGEYGAVLNGMFPGHYFYNVWSGAYSDFARDIVMEEFIRSRPDRLRADNPKSFKVLFQGTSFERAERTDPVRKPKLELLDVLEREETVYLLKLH